jgi:hypothetical protein
MGIVRVRTVGYKATGEIVIEFERSLLVYKQAHAPLRELPQPKEN